MRETRYQQARREGRCAVGTVCALDGYATSHLLAELGMEFLVIDRQHAAYDWSALENMVWRLRATGAGVYVRCAGQTEDELNLTLDLPVDGLIVPNIESLEQARRALDLCLMPPRGHRSVGNIRNARLQGADFRSLPDPEIGLLIEHIDAVDAIDEIAALEGLSMLFIGQHDLAGSMRLDPNTESNPSDRVDEAIARVRAAADARGVPLWTWAPTAEAARASIAAGDGAVMLSVDGLLLASAVEAALAELHAA